MRTSERMAGIAYVNGRYVPRRHASVHIEDRGYQFSDGVYEVIAVASGHLVDEEKHHDRLDRSLAELSIASPCSRAVLRFILRQVIRRNGICDGILYVQVTRGVAPRNHAFPKTSVRPALVVTANRLLPPSPALVEMGVSVVTVPENRWGRPDIKSVSLLPNVLAKQQAVEAGAYEAWFVDANGLVTEGSSTNAWIVTADGEVVTRDLSRSILAGITRDTVLEVAKARQVRVTQRAFSLEEARSAREAFITSTTSFVLPVVAIDGEKIGDGRPGAIARVLLEAYRDGLV